MKSVVSSHDVAHAPIGAPNVAAATANPITTAAPVADLAISELSPSPSIASAISRSGQLNTETCVVPACEARWQGSGRARAASR